MTLTMGHSSDDQCSDCCPRSQRSVNHRAPLGGHDVLTETQGNDPALGLLALTDWVSLQPCAGRSATL